MKVTIPGQDIGAEVCLLESLHGRGWAILILGLDCDSLGPCGASDPEMLQWLCLGLLGLDLRYIIYLFAAKARAYQLMLEPVFLHDATGKVEISQHQSECVTPMFRTASCTTSWCSFSTWAKLRPPPSSLQRRPSMSTMPPSSTTPAEAVATSHEVSIQCAQPLASFLSAEGLGSRRGPGDTACAHPLGRRH